MSPLNVNLTELIAELDTELGGGTELDKISEAQRRAHTLTDVGDQLVGHFVAKARESGASWSQIGDAIGVSKQAAQQRWVPPIFARFTDRARQVVVLAQEQARSHGHQEIDTEHVLLGLLGVPEGVAAKILAELAGSLDAVEQAVTAKLHKDGKKALRGHLPLTTNAKQIFEKAAEESTALIHNFIGTEHLLLGTLLVPGGVAFDVLGDLGITIDTARPKVIEALAGYVARQEQGK